MAKLSVTVCLMVLLATPAAAATAREELAAAAFNARDKATALAEIDKARAAADAALSHDPADAEARLVHAMAMAYRAKLTSDRSAAVEAGKLFRNLAAADPRNPETQAAIGAWNIDSVTKLGGFVAGMALGAKKDDGLAALDRAVSLGGQRAMFNGLAALLRLTLDPEDIRARPLAEAAARGSTPTPLDQVMRQAAAAVLVPLRAGDTRAAAALAKQLLPFGRIGK